MVMQTLDDLRAHADRKLLAGDAHSALHAYAALVRLLPSNLDVRLRLGDSLLALGKAQEAAQVYASLARHATHAGHPLHALVALKLLTALEPQLGALLTGFAQLYAVDSEKLGPAVRLSLGEGTAPLPEGFDPKKVAPVNELAPVAAEIGADTSQIAAYPERVPPIPLFSQLPSEAFAAVLAAVKLIRARPGDTIIEEGEIGQAFYVLARGAVQVTRVAEEGRETVLANLHAGAVFGEMALVSAQPRTATVRAVEDCDLLKFDKEALAAVETHVDVVARALETFARERMVNNLLATAKLFQPLDKHQRIDLARRFVAHDIAKGTTIIKEGAEGQGLFVLLSGEADVWKRDGDEKVLLSTLKPGDVFGEIALILDEPTTATVTAATQCTVLFLAKGLFQKLAEAIPEIGDYVEELGEERIMDTRILMADTAVETLDDDELVFI